MLSKLPRREREIVDLLYLHREVTAAQLCDLLEGEVSNSAVRAMLRRLEAKGFVRHRVEGKGFLYAPALPAASVKQSRLREVVRTFFDDSPVSAATALLGMSEKLKPDDLDRLEALIAQARKESEQ
ncbi:MAG TPA: BlaI/MecI/CopY family transcriptional regulator [Sphingomicrobium sp.]|nr:BlaI/MecI/CopY family transcriptional regulator [Sphingomicrobium sp.]